MDLFLKPPVVCMSACRYYGEVFPASGKKDAAILDLCSSWISHYPKGYTAGRIAGGHQRPEPDALNAPALAWLVPAHGHLRAFLLSQTSCHEPHHGATVCRSPFPKCPDASYRTDTLYHVQTFMPPLCWEDLFQQGRASGGEGGRPGCAGLGMNEDELKRNPVLTEWVVKDLNAGTALLHI